MFKKKIEFGNYTLTFGDKKVLLDKFTEIVMPSFVEGRYFRSYAGKSEYFFLDTQVIQLNDSKNKPEYALKGKLVKNTKLQRYQIYENGELVSDKKELDSAPSSSFLLLLSNHRLIFTKEVPNAPSIKNFETISSCFLKKRYLEYINEKYNNKIANGIKVTKKELEIDTPEPFLRITPLTDNESLNEFILRFEKINNVSVTLLPTNNEEFDLDDFWNNVDTLGEDINSNTVKLEFRNNEGSLKADKVYEKLSSAVAHGNTNVKLRGFDDTGASISGNNDDFKLVVEVNSHTQDTEDFEEVQYSEYSNLVKNGVIVEPTISQRIYNRLKEIFS